MPSPTNDILNPLSLVLPKLTTAQRDLLLAEVGTIIYNTTTNTINYCDNSAVGSDNWKEVTTL